MEKSIQKRNNPRFIFMDPGQSAVADFAKKKEKDTTNKNPTN